MTARHADERRLTRTRHPGILSSLQQPDWSTAMRIAAFLTIMVAILSIATIIAAASVAERLQTTTVAVAGSRG